MRQTLRAAASIGIAAVMITSLRAETAQEIAAGIVYARGGLARIQNIQTERMSGTVSVGDQQGFFVREIKRPGKARMEITLNGNTTVETYDGAVGWRLDGSNKQARELTGNEKKQFAEEADLDGPFVDAEAKGTQMEAMAKEMLGESQVWKLKVALKSGATEFYYVESTGYYILRLTSIQNGKEEDVLSDTLYRSFRRVEGVLFPFSITSFLRGEEPATTLSVQSIELNVAINDADFERPESRGTPTPMNFKQDAPQRATPNN